MTKLTSFTFVIIALSTLFNNQIAKAEQLIELQYDGFKISYNCSKRGFEHYTYKAVKDTANFKRKGSFHHEKRLPEHCQQKSNKTYKLNSNINGYDRGHGVPANHFDYSKEAVNSTNTMANVVPHQRKLNQTGLWRYTDKIIECNRDTKNVFVYGGVIWGDDSTNDYFLNSHGVVTPDYLYKIIVINEKYQAWIMPNDKSPRSENADLYRVKVSEIESRTGRVFGLHEIKSSSSTTWKIGKYCKLS